MIAVLERNCEEKKFLKSIIKTIQFAEKSVPLCLTTTLFRDTLV